MKTNSEDISGKDATSNSKMTRKQAISKAGFIAISVATTMILLSFPKVVHASPGPAAPDSPGSGVWTKRTSG